MDIQTFRYVWCNWRYYLQWHCINVFNTYQAFVCQPPNHFRRITLKFCRRCPNSRVSTGCPLESPNLLNPNYKKILEKNCRDIGLDYTMLSNRNRIWQSHVTWGIKFKSSFTSLLEVGADKASLGINTATAKTIKAISETLFLDSCFFKRSCRQDDFVNLNFRFVEYAIVRWGIIGCVSV